MKELTFTERQVQVCGLIVAGASPKEIARELDIGTRTVRFHMECSARKIRRHAPSFTGSPKRIICSYFVATSGAAVFKTDAA